MATEQEMIAALRAADKAGNTADARRIAAMIERQRQTNAAPRADTRPTSFWQGFKEEIAKANANTARLMQYNPFAPRVGGGVEAAIIDRARKEQSRRSRYQGSTAGRIAGGVAATLPTLAVPGGPLAQGALGGAMLSEAGGDPLGMARDAAIGGAAGKVGDVVGKRVIAPVVSRAVGSRPVQAAVNATRTAVGALPKPKLPIRVPGAPRSAQARAARLEAVGVKNPTTGMVTRDPAAWTAERELAKGPAGAELQQAFRGAYSDIDEAARGIVRDLGGAPGPEGAGLASQKVLDAKNARMQEDIGALYQGVRDTVGAARIPALENLKAVQNHPDWWGNADFDNMAAAINKRLANMADADNGASGLTVKQAEELRKFIGNLGADSRQTFAMRKLFKDALDTDVLDNFGGQPFAEARAAAAARFNEFEKTLTGKVAEGKVAPERLPARLMSSATPLKDLRKFRGSLAEGTGDAGVEAQKALQAQLVDDLFAKGIRSDGDNVTLNPQTLMNAWNQNAARYRELLGPDVYKQVRRTVMATRDVAADPALSYANRSNTASAAANNPLAQIFAKAGGPSRVQKILRPVLSGAGGAIAGTVAGGPVGGVAGAAGAAGMAAGLDEYLARKAAEQLQKQVMLALSPRAAQEASDGIVMQFARQAENEARKKLYGDIIGGLLAPPAAAGAVLATQ